jgi:AAA+ ATPase superfamily predicted ATPase
MRSFSVIRDIKFNDSGSSFAFSYAAKRIAVGPYRNRIDILELESGNKILTIQQELHCIRTNIFGVTGLREDQREMMLKRGAVEVDLSELERTGEKVGPYIRQQQLQELVGNLKEGYKRKRIPAVLILGPGTFLPPLNLLDKDDRYFFDRFEIPFPLKKEMLAEEWNDHMDFFYYEMLKEGRHYFRENRWREKSGKMTSRNLELLRKNYNSLVHLVNEGLFPIVIDMDIFSELNREMFGIEPFKESYRDMEDLDYSIRQLGREMDYLEKGRGFYFKVFSEEGSYKKRYMMRDEKNPERFLERMFEEIFHKIFYRYDKELQVVWTGFWPRHIMRDMPFRRMERGQNFYWVVDESLRESHETEYIEATFLDYPLGKFSDFFYDLHRALEFDDKYLMMGVPIGISELKSRVYSESVEKRLEAALALPARAASPLASRKTLHMQEELFYRLLHDTNLEVRQTLLREIINRIEQLPPDINTIIEGFSEDKDDSVRADIAAWIIGQYDRFGKEYEPILLKLAKDRSQYVRATIINTIKRRFEQLPSNIRQLASQLVGTGLAVEMVRGGGMLMDTPTELVLEITNHGLESISTADIEILISAEYNIESNNPVILTQLEPESPAQVVFTIRPRANHRIPVNYKVNGELREPPLQVNVILDNPYIYGNPIDSSDSFFGRQQELVDIVQAVSKPNKQDILLVGERRTGKSSLFYQILKHLNPPFFPVYIVLNEAPDKADSVVSFICGKVIRFFIERLALPTDPWNNFKCSSLGLTDNLKTILDAAHKTKPDLKLVLLLDEADFILKVEDRLQNLMRAAFQSLEVGSVVRAVVAGTTDLSTYVSQRSSPFFNHFRFVYLRPLGDGETRDLITKPAESLGYTYEAAAVERIAKACGGHPYYCQRICYEAFLQSIKTKHPIITHAQAESAVRKVIQEADAYNGFITGFWKAALPRQPLTSSQKKFLKNLANGKSTAKVKKSEIQRLLDWQLVKECNGDYRYTCELFEEWTKQAPLR